MTTKQWAKYRSLSNEARNLYREARLSGHSHKHAWKRATAKPKQGARTVRMAAVPHPMGA